MLKSAVLLVKLVVSKIKINDFHAKIDCFTDEIGEITSEIIVVLLFMLISAVLLVKFLVWNNKCNIFYTEKGCFTHEIGDFTSSKIIVILGQNCGNRKKTTL